MTGWIPPFFDVYEDGEYRIYDDLERLVLRLNSNVVYTSTTAELSTDLVAELNRNFPQSAPEFETP